MVRRQQFDRLWDDSSPEQRIELKQYIFEANRDKVKKWMRDHPSLALAEKPLCDLQKIAYKLGIPNYSRQGKLELVRTIKAKEDKYGSQQGIPASGHAN